MIPDLTLAGVAEVGLTVLVGSLVGVFVVSLVWDLMRTRDVTEASQRSSRRAGGALLGAGGVGTTVAVSGVEVVAQVPEMLITALGVAALLGGWSWEVFAATAVVAFLAGEAITS